jgi:hypothetical protein
MPLNGFNIGRDVSITLNDSTPGVGALRFGLITSFNEKMMTSDEEFMGLDGITRRLRYVKGWSGQITIQRQDSAVDDYFARIEDGFYQGLSESPLYISKSMQEVNGSVTQWRHYGVLLKYDDAGTAQGDKSIVQTLSWVAIRRKKVA